MELNLTLPLMLRLNKKFFYLFSSGSFYFFPLLGKMGQKKRIGVIKRLARAGKKFVSPYAKKAIVKAGKSKYTNAAIIAGATALTENPITGLAGGDVAIKGKDYLLDKYLGTKNNKDSSHSGKNYAVKRQPAVRFNNPKEAPAFKSERLIKEGHVPGEIATNASLPQNRNVSHITSGPRPTGSKM